MIKLIKTILNDHEHGSKDIAQRFLATLQNLCEDENLLKPQISEILHFASIARPSMVIFQNIAQRLEKILSEESGNASIVIANGIKTLFVEMTSSDNRIYQNAERYFIKHNFHSVLTHSRSSTVEYTLKRLGQSGIVSSLICTESRPLYEGVAMANALSNDIQSMVIADALADSVMDECDCVVLGADAVDRLGNILNKIGSRMIALSAKDHEIPVICLAESMKIHPTMSIRELPGELHDESELGHELKKNISIRNQYFEVVETNLITRLISDNIGHNL